MNAGSQSILEPPPPVRARASLAGSAIPAVVPAGKRRLESLDFVRGLAMALMALDHLRSAFVFSEGGADAREIAPALMVTRLVTHFCAPAFILLAGVGAALSVARGRSRAEVATFLVTRGLMLVLLDLVVFNASLDLHHVGLGVIWTIGWSMVALASGLWLPQWGQIVGAGVLLFLPRWMALSFSRVTGSGFWTALVTGGSVDLTGGVSLSLQYPVLPWAAVMLLGYRLGDLFGSPAERRKRWLMTLGIAALALFVVLRGFTTYGDPVSWDRNGLLDFFHCAKYPPSPAFLLMTLGPPLLLLGVVDGREFIGRSALVTLGQVALFFYVVHRIAIRALVLVLGRWLGAVPEAGLSLPVVYGLWVGFMLVLYPFCRWFAGLKRRSTWAWLRYV